MNLIAAVDQNWAIGNKNKLLIRIPADMKYFRQMTTGHVVIMGRHTLESFPDGAPLKDRTNLVLSKDLTYTVTGATVLHSVEEAIEAVAGYDPEDVFVIGGERIYRQFLPYCDKAYITKMDRTFEADAYLSNLDASPDWKMTKTSEEGTYFDTVYVFTEYERV